MNECRGCGTAVEPTESEVNQGVTEILQASLKDAIKHGEICPLCGHSKAQPVSERNSVQSALLMASVAIVLGLAIAYFINRHTERQQAALDALKQIESNSVARELLGFPITIRGTATGDVRQDETGWRELHLVIPVHGPNANGNLRISGGQQTGPWRFTTEELTVPQLKKKADLLTGRVVEYSPDAYEVIHTEAVSIPEYVNANVPPPSWDGRFPCVYANLGPGTAPQLGSCATPVPMSADSRQSVDRFETDLRTGNFVMRQTDLMVNEAGFDVPLTRTYNAQDRMSGNRSHAFGMNANHGYDIAPLGTRNPYTEQYIVLENGDFLYFPRVSTGTGYSDAIYRHSETSTSFYGATQQWDGDGWLTRLRDGSTIHFPESYNARNLAQGAAIEMADASGKKIELIRDPKRNLQRIETSQGTAIQFSYDNNDRIVRAEDSKSGWTNYTYNAAGYLTDVVHSTGAARHYDYEDGLLTSVRDEKGRVLVHNSFSGLLLVRQEFGDGKTVRYDYIPSYNRMYVKRVSVTLPDGSVKAIDPSGSISLAYKRSQ